MPQTESMRRAALVTGGAKGIGRPFSSCARSLEPPRASFSDSYSLPIRNFFRSGSRFLRPSWFWQIHERAA